MGLSTTLCTCDSMALMAVADALQVARVSPEVLKCASTSGDVSRAFQIAEGLLWLNAREVISNNSQSFLERKLLHWRSWLRTE